MAGLGTGQAGPSRRAKQARLRFETIAAGGSPAAGGATGQSVIYNASATDLLQYVPENSIDLCITSPPYWDILNQRRTADSKAVRHYGNLQQDLGIIADYGEFLSALTSLFADVLRALKPRAHCCIVLIDLPKKHRFY